MRDSAPLLLFLLCSVASITTAQNVPIGSTISYASIAFRCGPSARFELLRSHVFVCHSTSATLSWWSASLACLRSVANGHRLTRFSLLSYQLHSYDDLREWRQVHFLCSASGTRRKDP